MTVVDRFDGKKLNSPNDVVVKTDGTFWFTNPPYGLRDVEVKEQAGNYVFRRDLAIRTTTVLVQDFGGRDWKTLFITAREGLYAVELKAKEAK